MSAARPRIRVPLTPLQLILEAIALVTLFAMIVYVWQNWPAIPDKVPQKFNSSGQPIHYGSRESIWLMPGIAAVLYAVSSVLQRLPHHLNYPSAVTPKSAPRLYAIGVSLMIWTKIEMVLLFAILTWRQIELALGRADTLGSWFIPTLVIANLATAGYHIWRMRQAR